MFLFLSNVTQFLGCFSLKLPQFYSLLLTFAIWQHTDRRWELLWAPAQRKRATMLYFANVFYLFIYIFMAALFSGPG